MTKYQKLEEPVFITSCESRRSKHGGDIWEIHFKGIKTQQDFKTYTAPDYANWHNWSHIIPLTDRKGIVLSNLKLKDVDLVNADSMPTVNYVVTKEELAECLAEFWDSQDRFRGLFE